MEARILNYREGTYEYHPEVITADKEKHIDIKVTSFMKLRRDADYFGFQLTFTYSVDNKILMNFGFIIVMSVAGWIPLTSSDNIDTTSPETEVKTISEIIFSRAPEQINQACRTAMDFARGAMAAKLGDTTKSRVAFPDIRMEEFVKTINFKVVK